MLTLRRALVSFAALNALAAVVACGTPGAANEAELNDLAASPEVIDGPISPRARSSWGDQISFDLKPIAKNIPCLAQFPSDPNRQPSISVTVKRGSVNDEMTVSGKYFKPGIDFDLFTVERSTLDAKGAPDASFKGFGMAWYQSDLEADSTGTIRATIKTILLDQIFGFDPDVKLDPKNTFHVGFWFNDPNAAVACGFDASKPTPFNGEHKAGPLAFISTPNAQTWLGPLCTKPDTSVSPARCNP
jgi:hypothetical protein